MNELNKYYEQIAPAHSPEDTARSVMARAASARPEKRRGFKPAAIAAAAAVVMAGGATAAAAGLLNINGIFGGRITAEDEQLAGALVGATKDFTWTTSDDNYAIELKGVTGSESDMLLMYEIVRTDGKPVTDFMTNIPEDGELRGLVDIAFSDEYAFSESHDNNRYTINEEGNIEVYNRIITNGDISGQYYSVEAVNLYPKRLLRDFEQEHDVFVWSQKRSNTPIGFYADSKSFYAKQPTDIALNDERIIGLELEWSIGFTYLPSETAKLPKVIADEGAAVTLNYWKTFAGGGTDTRIFEITDSYFSSVGGRIEAVHCGEKLYGSSFENHNDIYLITEDGRRQPCTVIVGSLGYVGNYEIITTINIEIRYSETENGPTAAVDIAKAEAISINGEVFPLA